jgi:hypothetical protein
MAVRPHASAGGARESGIFRERIYLEGWQIKEVGRTLICHRRTDADIYIVTHRPRSGPKAMRLCYIQVEFLTKVWV